MTEKTKAIFIVLFFVILGWLIFNSLGSNQELDRDDLDSGKCHPSYSGKCLKKNTGDYDCAGGSGNGPNYTRSVRVVGPDVFGLDRDGDGIGCE